MAKWAICIADANNQGGSLCRIVDGGDAEKLAIMGDNGLVAYKHVEITDAEFAGLLKSTHTFDWYNNDSYQITEDANDSNSNEAGRETKELLQESIDGEIEMINNWINYRPNHPDKSIWESYKTLLQNINLDALNLTFPECTKTPAQLVEDAGGTPRNPALELPNPRT
tara:strand:- start:72 stop:575 length:504 start_codon:yes stop_codon:yes gene_type:complete